MKVSIIIIVFCAVLRVYGAKEICPKVCICDVYEGFKRADCSEQNLISPEINLAKSVEILNLSGNQIAVIDNENFRDYVDLINLSLAKNAIHTIELFAFTSLAKLSYLDLSDNRLELIDNRMVEANEMLTVLDLSKNKFMMSFEDAPLVVSRSLEFLSLRNAQLSFIYDSFFERVPSLLDLDISNNLLISLKSSAFFPIDKLQFVNLEYNSFACDTQMERTIQFLKQRKVFIKIDKCMNVKKPKMFEKMIMLTSSFENDSEESKEDVEIDLVWGANKSATTSSDANFQHVNGMLRDYYIELKNNLEEESYCKNDEFAPMLCECRQNYIMHFEMTNRTHVVLRKNVEMRINAVFYIGVFLGAVCGCIIFYCLLVIKRKWQKAKRKQMDRQHIRNRIVREFNQEVREAPQPTAPSPQPIAPSPLPQRSAPPQVQQPVRASPIMRNSVRTAPTYNPQSPLMQRQMMNEFSPTANLLHKLFRNREIQQHQPAAASSTFYTPVPPPRRRSSDLPRPSSSQAFEILPEVLETATSAVDGNDSDSEYMSISESIILEPDRSTTPPPAYREIYE